MKAIRLFACLCVVLAIALIAYVASMDVPLQASQITHDVDPQPFIQDAKK